MPHLRALQCVAHQRQGLGVVGLGPLLLVVKPAKAGDGLAGDQAVGDQAQPGIPNIVAQVVARAAVVHRNHRLAQAGGVVAAQAEAFTARPGHKRVAQRVDAVDDAVSHFILRHQCHAARWAAGLSRHAVQDGLHHVRHVALAVGRQRVVKPGAAVGLDHQHGGFVGCKSAGKAVNQLAQAFAWVPGVDGVKNMVIGLDAQPLRQAGQARRWWRLQRLPPCVRRHKHRWQPGVFSARGLHHLLVVLAGHHQPLHAAQGG